MKAHDLLSDKPNMGMFQAIETAYRVRDPLESTRQIKPLADAYARVIQHMRFIDLASATDRDHPIHSFAHRHNGHECLQLLRDADV
jgi:hypothetical protein